MTRAYGVRDAGTARVPALRVAVVGPDPPLQGRCRRPHDRARPPARRRPGTTSRSSRGATSTRRSLYPGEQVGARTARRTSTAVSPDASACCRWDRPGHLVADGGPPAWSRTAVDVVVVVARGARQRPRPAHPRQPPCGAGRFEGPRVVVLAHNVVPHETHPGGRVADGAPARRRRRRRSSTPRDGRAGGGELGAATCSSPRPAARTSPAGSPPEAGPPRRGAAAGRRDTGARTRHGPRLQGRRPAAGGRRATVPDVAADDRRGAVGPVPGERVRELAADPRLAGRVERAGGLRPRRARSPELSGSTTSSP